MRALPRSPELESTFSFVFLYNNGLKGGEYGHAVGKLNGKFKFEGRPSRVNR
jgi:hypothetical protein